MKERRKILDTLRERERELHFTKIIKSKEVLR